MLGRFGETHEAHGELLDKRQIAAMGLSLLALAVGIVLEYAVGTRKWVYNPFYCVGLVLLGELVQQKFFASGPDQPAGEEPLGPLPDVRTLTLALVVALLLVFAGRTYASDRAHVLTPRTARFTLPSCPRCGSFFQERQRQR